MLNCRQIAEFFRKFTAMMSKRQIVGAIAVLTTLALVGLISIQVYLLHSAMELERQTFRQNVHAALGLVARNLEVREAAATVVAVSLDLKDGSEELAVSINAEEDSFDTRSSHFTRILHRGQAASDTCETDSSDQQSGHVKLLFPDTLLQRGGSANLNFTTSLKGKQQSRGVLVTKEFKVVPDSNAFFFDAEVGSSGFNYSFKSVSPTRKKALVDRVLRRLSEDLRQPVAERIDASVLDSLMVATFADKGIHTPFAYGVVLADGDSVVLANQPERSADIVKSSYRSTLFPFDVLVQQNTLAVVFPEEKIYLLRKIAVSTAASLFFILVLIASFVYILRIIVRQGDFSRRLTGFINNMVHEFKTPISTIALASESISRTSAVENQQKIIRYGQIIQDENQRMRLQVDKILQMAVLEEGDFELKLAPVDLHELIENTVQKVALQVEARKGKLVTRLLATRHLVEADALHLANILFNLVENAVKYTKGAPRIQVTTSNLDGQVQIQVKDNGIGLSPADHARIFEKYYRVPTGNLHDVKGFGLGLSYVKLMVEAHGGSIAVESELGEGATFDLRFACVGEK